MGKEKLQHGEANTGGEPEKEQVREREQEQGTGGWKGDEELVAGNNLNTNMLLPNPQIFPKSVQASHCELLLARPVAWRWWTGEGGVGQDGGWTLGDAILAGRAVAYCYGCCTWGLLA